MEASYDGIWQRLSPQHTLQAVVREARRGGADALRSGSKPLSACLRSAGTAGFAKARRRLPLAWVQQCFGLLARELPALAPVPEPGELPVRLLDGSTLRLRHHGDIPRKLGRHRTRRKKSYWCGARVVVSFCAASGLALSAWMGALCRSEQALAVPLILHAAAQALYVGDRNFGVWRVVRACVQAGSQPLVRLTSVRARCLAGGPPFETQ